MRGGTPQKNPRNLLSPCSLRGTPQKTPGKSARSPSRDPKSLAKRIDYWLEHSRERREMELEYADLAEGYDIRKSISELIDMYKLACHSERSEGICHRARASCRSVHEISRFHGHGLSVVRFGEGNGGAVLEDVLQIRLHNAERNGFRVNYRAD